MTTNDAKLDLLLSALKRLRQLRADLLSVGSQRAADQLYVTAFELGHDIGKRASELRSVTPLVEVVS